VFSDQQLEKKLLALKWKLEVKVKHPKNMPHPNVEAYNTTLVKNNVFPVAVCSAILL